MSIKHTTEVLFECKMLEDGGILISCYKFTAVRLVHSFAIY